MKFYHVGNKVFGTIVNPSGTWLHLMFTKKTLKVLLFWVHSTTSFKWNNYSEIFMKLIFGEWRPMKPLGWKTFTPTYFIISAKRKKDCQTVTLNLSNNSLDIECSRKTMNISSFLLTESFNICINHADLF